MNRNTKKCLTMAKSFDQFKQGVTLRSSKQIQSLPSWIGLLFTLPVAVISLFYLSLKWTTLVNKLGTVVTVVETRDKLVEGSTFEFTMG